MDIDKIEQTKQGLLDLYPYLIGWEEKNTVSECIQMLARIQEREDNDSERVIR